MYREDYILRLIKRAAAILARVSGMARDGQNQRALEVIEEAIEELVGLNAVLVRNIDDRTIMRLLTVQGRLDTGRLVVLADLVRAEGDVLAAQGLSAEAAGKYARSLNYCLEIVLDDHSTIEPELVPRIEYLWERLTNVSLHGDIPERFRSYCEWLLLLEDNELERMDVSRSRVEMWLNEIRLNGS